MIKLSFYIKLINFWNFKIFPKYGNSQRPPRLLNYQAGPTYNIVIFKVTTLYKKTKKE